MILLPQLLLVAAVLARTSAAADESVVECSLVLIGHSNNSSFNISDGSSSSIVLPMPGVAHASLHCTGQGRVAVAVNSTYMSKHAANFTGVTVVSSSDCKQQADGETHIYPLLQFCGSYTVRLLQPLVQRVWLQNGSDAATDATESWLGAVLAFADGVNATI